jgi:rhodanese-related sulfurtransferase
MKKYFSIFTCLLLLTGCSNNEPESTQSIRSVVGSDFKALAESNEYTIIDIRTPEELLPANGGKIFEDALNIDFYAADFAEKIAALDPRKKYLLYCHSGNRSGQTLDMMKAAGFQDVADLGGGKITWDRFYGS